MDKMLRRLIPEDIDLRTALAEGLGSVRADPGQIEQVILNLAVNARDAMPEGGRLTIETANVELDELYTRRYPGVRPASYILLAVTDTGVGMEPETQAHLFEPFFTTKLPGIGTGLGLSTVYGIVKQSGGHISVYSEQGRGSTFKVYLPRVVASAAEEGGAQAAPEAAPGSETVLVVEDEPVLRNLVRRVLARGGYDVLTASNADEAIRVADAHPTPIHLMVTDVVMPGAMNGRDLGRYLAARRPQMRVLYMSGYAENAIVHQGVLDRDVAFLPKPFSPSNLIDKVRAVLAAPPRT
jgi:CheY-like chemotaxis protein